MATANGASAASRRLLSSLLSTLLWVPVGVAFNDYAYGFARVDGESMQPTLNPKTNGQKEEGRDIVLVNKWSARSRNYREGDIVVLRSPEAQFGHIVKRIVGLPGSWVRSSDGTVLRVPQGRCWVEGDNKAVSNDSNHFGPTPLALIEGTVVRVLWPPSRFRSLKNDPLKHRTSDETLYELQSRG